MINKYGGLILPGFLIVLWLCGWWTPVPPAEHTVRLYLPSGEVREWLGVSSVRWVNGVLYFDDVSISGTIYVLKVGP